MKKIVVLLLIVVCGCQLDNSIDTTFDNSETHEESILSRVKFSNSRLVVKDYETLKELINYVSSMSPLEYRRFVNSFPSFETMYDLYDLLTDLENIESDKLFDNYQKTGVFPEVIHPEIPINSSKTLEYLDYLYFYDDGGFIPYASTIIPLIELVLNNKGEIIISDELVTFSKSKFQNSKLNENISINRLENTNSLSPVTINGTETNGNNRITYSILFESPISSSFIRLSGNVLVRNWRKGFFGWNTRNTKSLKIEGNLRYNVELGISNFPCVEECNYPGCTPGNVCAVAQRLNSNYNDLDISSNGNDVKQLSFNFVLPQHGNWTGFVTSATNRRNFSTNLTLRGPNQLSVNIPHFSSPLF
ncbi:hypothetical protein [Arthrospiribacter ruber]|uniref:DUF4848 domain-containing protein n=1 Tax=Arthrospiribacter ruber TaxID=2487934 RepID=A0A951IWQ0_9BACT|nr:hypothetical protein [Arthrospiribacter ruber]MBW3467722.1 DUF4848 domain-containing protein [Arthrospiribacter ruber]